MVEKNVHEILSFSERFLRSTNLERDFYNPKALSSYILTDYSQKCLARIANGLETNSGQRAWRITGDYGSGKSSFALFLAHWFSGNTQALPSKVGHVRYQQPNSVPPRLIPVLITGSRDAIGPAIVRGLINCVNSLPKTKGKTQLVSELSKYSRPSKRISGETLCELIKKTNTKLIESRDGTGLILILDELGKFLEHAAMNPEQQDVYVLQQLAELSARSAGKPVFLLGLLHQGFSAYADQLSQSAQREWEKVAARFEEIIFNQPLEQIGVLIAAALNTKAENLPKATISESNNSMAQACKFRWFGACSSSTLLSNATKLYPLHPTVLPILVRIFNRFGQNERSLFSFLLSNEPFGLRDFAHKYKLVDHQFYRLHDLYDYVKFNFGHRLSMQSYRSHWNQIDSMIDSFMGQDELEVKILKTVGILNLLNSNDLLATKQVISLSIAGMNQRIAEQIDSIVSYLQQTKRVLYYRGTAGGLCLWPHTSVNIEQAYENAGKAVGAVVHAARFVKDYIQPRPIVARRHYIETGNLRFFNVKYVSASDLCLEFISKLAGSDGHLLTVLCESEDERRLALDFAISPDLKNYPNVILAITPSLNSLCGLVHEAQRWEWVSTNTLELNVDRYAAEEVARQVAASKLSLSKRIQYFIGLNQLEQRTPLKFYVQTKTVEINTGRQLLAELSSICDKLFPQAPLIKNELINRSSVSAAAAAARMRLIERMFSSAKEEFLGMDPGKKPPEMSIYLSVMKYAGLHRKWGAEWKLSEPTHTKDNCRLLPVFHEIQNILAQQIDNRVKVSDIIDILQRPPYGMRDGLIPLILAVFIISRQHEIAMYENGTFVKNIGAEEMLRLIKAPECFELQHCKIVGLRGSLFEKLLSMLELCHKGNNRTEFLEIVRALCTFVAKLPEYALHTTKLQRKAFAVRNAILSARDPSKLLFTELPLACGYEPFGLEAKADNKIVQEYVISLREALDELKLAYPGLHARLKNKIQKTFDYSSPFDQTRKSIAERSEKIIIYIKESKLKAFCLRLIDANLPESEWTESLGSLVVSTPPSNWRDIDEEKFYQEIESLIASFKRVEAIFFSKSAPDKDNIGIRLAITKADGTEREQVFHFTPDEQTILYDLKTEISQILRKNGRLGLIATSEAVWQALDKKEFN